VQLVLDEPAAHAGSIEPESMIEGHSPAHFRACRIHLRVLLFSPMLTVSAWPVKLTQRKRLVMQDRDMVACRSFMQYNRSNGE
jgi:hypothetical protein